MYKAGSQKNKIGNKAIGNKFDDKTGTKGKGLGTKRCIRLGARKIKLKIRQLETKWMIRLGPRAQAFPPRPSPPDNLGRRERSKQARIVWGEGRGGNVCPRTAGQLFRGDRSWGKAFFQLKGGGQRIFQGRNKSPGGRLF